MAFNEVKVGARRKIRVKRMRNKGNEKNDKYM